MREPLRPLQGSRVADAQPDRLPRQLGTGASLALVVGLIIGSGIFRVPSAVAAAAGSGRAALLAWALGGAITLCGALSLAELGAMFPRSGGVYVFLLEAYGPRVAFLKGWVHLIFGPSVWAALALIFAEYARNFFPLTDTGTRLLAAALIALVAAASCRSLRFAASVQGATTVAKVLALLGMATVLFAFGHHGGGTLSGPLIGTRGWSGIGLALIPVLFAYDGWNAFTAMCGEVRNPGRSIPFALIAGVLLVTIVYVIVNVAYLLTLPLDTLQGSTHVATDAVGSVAGRASASILAALVMLSTFGALTATIIVDPRIYFAMAETGLFFRSVARVHSRWRTPYVAIALNAGLSMLYIFFRTFDQLAEAFVLGTWPFLALAAGAVLVLRRALPQAPRPYRTVGYPFVPLLFIAACAGLVLNALYRHPVSTALSLAVILLGLPVYWVWRVRASSRPSS